MKTKIEHNAHGYLVYALDAKGWQFVGVFDDEENAREKAKEVSLKPEDFKTIYYKDGQQTTCEK